MTPKIQIAATLILINFLVIAGVRVVAGMRVPSTSLRNLLRAEGCITSCWQGIEPSLTDRTAVQALLGNNEMAFAVAQSPGEREAYVWQLDRSSPLANPSDAASVVVEFNTDDIVWRVALTTLDICFSSVLDAFGIPPLADGDAHILRLGYPQQGLMFGVDLDAERITTIFITTDERVRYFSQLAAPPRWDFVKDQLAGDCADRLGR